MGLLGAADGTGTTNQIAGIDAVQPLGVFVQGLQQAEEIVAVEQSQGEIHVAGEGLVDASGEPVLRPPEGLLGADGIREARKLQILVRPAQGLDPVEPPLAADNPLLLELLEHGKVAPNHGLLLVHGAVPPPGRPAAFSRRA